MRIKSLNNPFGPERIIPTLPAYGFILGLAFAGDGPSPTAQQCFVETKKTNSALTTTSLPGKWVRPYRHSMHPCYRYTTITYRFSRTCIENREKPMGRSINDPCRRGWCSSPVTTRSIEIPIHSFESICLTIYEHKFRQRCQRTTTNYKSDYQAH